MLTFSYILFGFLVLRWLVGLNNVLFPPKLIPQTEAQFPYVSILIPVRNEAHNLPHLFEQLSKLKDPNLEIIALNDHSEDGTELLLQSYAKETPFFRYINGLTLPEGWLGKNWACHQLSEEARGDFFLFLDADIAYLNERLLPRSIGEMERRQLSLMSIFPNQIMMSQGEKLVVPLMNYLLLSLLPLWSIYRIPLPSVSAANGQFMLFRARDYADHQWHMRVRKIIVEDISIMKEVKTEGLRGMSYLGSGLIHTRMYQSLEEGLKGFSKNILAGFGNRVIGLWIYLIFILFGWILAFMVLPLPLIGLSLMLVLSLRGMISYLAGQNIWTNILLHPLQMLALLWISMLSTWKKFSGKNEWKGRNVQLQ